MRSYRPSPTHILSTNHPTSGHVSAAHGGETRVTMCGGEQLPPPFLPRSLILSGSFETWSRRTAACVPWSPRQKSN